MTPKDYTPEMREEDRKRIELSAKIAVTRDRTPNFLKKLRRFKKVKFMQDRKPGTVHELQDSNYVTERDGSFRRVGKKERKQERAARKRENTLRGRAKRKARRKVQDVR